jgi:2-iminobutanoate/2-iminopropanoate deaminase
VTAIKRLLASVGLETADVVRVEVHLVDLDDMDEMNAVYGGFFVDGQAPARTTTQSTKLAGGAGVEITCMARVRGG